MPTSAYPPEKIEKNHNHYEKTLKATCVGLINPPSPYLVIIARERCAAYLGTNSLVVNAFQ